MTGGGDLLTAARSYSARCWTVVPIGANKKPPKGVAWKRWQTERPDDAQLSRWFNRADVTGLAVILGAASGGVLCRDFDSRPAFARWRAEHAELAERLPQVETHRGGHVYCQHGREVYQAFTDGELRGDSGHYSIAPPSKHPSGGVYRWILPLPAGPLPVVDDLAGAGLISIDPDRDTEKAEQAENVLCVSAVSALSVSDAVDDAIARTLPGTVGQRNRKLFDLARLLRSMPDFASGDVGAVRPIVRRWHDHALPVIGTKAFDDTWSDFTRAWTKVKFPIGAGPLADIAARARAADPPPEAERYDTPEARALVALCRELQRTTGEAPFFIASRTAGPLIGTDWRTAARYLAMLVADKVLAVAVTHTPSRATRYKYLNGEK